MGNSDIDRILHVCISTRDLRNWTQINTDGHGFFLLFNRVCPRNPCPKINVSKVKRKADKLHWTRSHWL